jgi:hypothetical protein
MREGLTRRELVAAAKRELVYGVTPDVFKAFREHGLVPRPAGRGPTALYPPGTLRQLIAVARLHENERRYDDLRLEVWWDGYWVEPERLRRTLAKILDDGVADLRAIRRQYPDPFDAAEAALHDTTSAAQPRSPVIRLMLSRMRRDETDLQTALHTLLVFAFGGEPEWETLDVDLEDPEPSPLELLTKMVGFARLVTDPVNRGEPLLTEIPDLRSELEDLRSAGILDIERPGRVMLGISDVDLEIARLRTRGFWDVLADAAQLIEYQHGRDTGGLGVLTVVRRRGLNWSRVFLVRYCLLIPALGTDAATDMLLAALGTKRSQFAAALTVVEAFPGYKPLLAAGGQQRLLKLPREEREHIAATLMNYLHEHPEVRRELEIQE